jgi:hypothetical protein
MKGDLFLQLSCLKLLEDCEVLVLDMQTRQLIRSEALCAEQA